MNKNVRVVRRVVIDDSLVITVTDYIETWFGAQFIASTSTKQRQDSASPRGNPDLLRYRGGVLEPEGGPLGPGARLEVDGGTFEVLSPPREVRVGRSLQAFEVPLLWIPRLYPVVGDLEEQGGALVTANVGFSVYATDESHTVTGTYEDLQAETDISHHAACRINRHLAVDGTEFKITSAEVDHDGAYVRMTVRKSGAS